MFRGITIVYIVILTNWVNEVADVTFQTQINITCENKITILNE